MSEPVGLCCPGCGQPAWPLSELLSDQAFCENPDCRVFMWTPSKTIAENMANAGHIDLPDVGESSAR